MSHRPDVRSDTVGQHKSSLSWMANQCDPILGSFPSCQCGASYFTHTRNYACIETASNKGRRLWYGTAYDMDFRVFDLTLVIIAVTLCTVVLDCGRSSLGCGLRSFQLPIVMAITWATYWMIFIIFATLQVRSKNFVLPLFLARHITLVETHWIEWHRGGPMWFSHINSPQKTTTAYRIWNLMRLR